MKCSEYRLYFFSEGVQGTLAFRKCTSLGHPVVVGAAVQESEVLDYQPTNDFERGPHNAYQLPT